MKLSTSQLVSNGTGTYAFQRKYLSARKKKKEKKKKRKEKSFIFRYNKELCLEALLSLILIFSLTYLA